MTEGDEGWYGRGTDLPTGILASVKAQHQIGLCSDSKGADRRGRRVPRRLAGKESGWSGGGEEGSQDFGY